ncbi:MAG: ester cyclase [Rhodobacteraceae bacterium]|nr:ester cyclase [Paracoccaceae bacterium]
MTGFQPDRSKSHHPAVPLSRAHMPTSFDISLRAYTKNGVHRIPPYLGPHQSMNGFDREYHNIIDYIVRITCRIWETSAREVDYIGACYSDDSRVYDDYGLQCGNAKIIADTHHTIGAFPDIVLDAEEVIWGGDDQIGFHTSHLTRILGTNTGSSRYGDATGKAVNVLVIANCVALGNDIFLEHVLYNTSALLQQLGIDLWAEADRLAADPPAGWPRSAELWNALRAAASPPQPLCVGEPVAGFDPDAFARDIHHNIWNGDGSTISENYIGTLPFEGTTERKFTGTEAYRAYVDSLRTAFPDLALQVDEVYWMGNPTEGYLISTRWSAEGTHADGTLYRDPTDHKCQIWGITQWRVQDDKVVQEWQLFNELDLMMQIAKARMDG